MSIIKRAARDRNFTILPNEIIEDDRLSWDAGMVLVYLLSKPDDWTVSRRHLQNLDRGAGEKALRRIFNELEEFGYMRRIKNRDEGGHFDWDTEVNDTPFWWDDEEIPGHTTRPSTARGSAARRSAARAQPAPLVRTEATKDGDELRTDGETAQTALFDDGEQSDSGDSVDYTEGFDEMWAFWPKTRRGSKKETLKRWGARIKEGATAEQLLRGGRNYLTIQEAERTELKYYKQAQTFYGPGDHWESFQELPDRLKKDQRFGLVEDDDSVSGEVSVAEALGL